MNRSKYNIKHMKLKNLFFISALLTIYSISAQKNKIQFGVKVGLNRAKGIVTDAHEIKFRTGYHIGGFVDYSLSSKFGLQAGLLLTEKGGKYVGLNSGSYIGRFPDYKHTLKALYIEFPISVIYKQKITEKWNINFGAGFYFAYGFSGKSRIDITGVYSDGTNFREWDTFIDDEGYVGESLNRFDTGVILKCELEWNKIFFGIGIENSFVNALRKYEGYNQELKLYNIPISVGYRF